MFGSPKREATTDHIIRALNDETYDQSVLSGDSLKRIIGKLPRWITYPDVERVGWLNRAVRVMWPFLNRAISNSVVGSVEPILNKLVEGTNVHMKFSRFTLGIDPLVLVSVKAVTEVPNEVGLDIETKWAATDPEVQLDVSFLGVVLPIAIEKVEFFGCVRVVFGPLCDWWPTFSDMQVAFIGKPTINFNLRLIGGDITAFPFVEKLLTNLIKNVLVNLMVWPNRLDIGITNKDGERGVNRSGILRIRVLRAVHLPNLDIMKAAAKMRPAVELEIRDGDYAKPYVHRVTQKGDGQNPRFVETFDVRVHDVRGARVEFTVVDTATIYKNMRNEVRGVFGSSKRKSSSEGARSANGEPVTNAREEMSKAEAALQASTSFEGETRLYKTAQSTLGVAHFEAGTLFDAPNERRSERLELRPPTYATAKITKMFASSAKGRDGKALTPEIAFEVEYLPFEEDLGEDDAEKEKVRDLTLRTLLSDENLDQFCGVLHVTLVRGDSLVSKDANGRSDPFVKLSLGKQQHKSSTKKATLNPVWDEEFDFVVGAYELESGQKIRMEVWDWDANGKREFMGSVSFDTKKVIARVLLMAGQASKVLKYTEELEETSAGRLHVEMEFHSIQKNRKAVESAVEAELIAGATSPKSDVQIAADRDRRIDEMRSASAKRGLDLGGGGSSGGGGGSSGGGASPREPPTPGHGIVSIDDVDLDGDDEPPSPTGGGCFGGCFGGKTPTKAATTPGKARADAPAAADLLPEIETATPKKPSSAEDEKPSDDGDEEVKAATDATASA